MKVILFFLMTVIGLTTIDGQPAKVNIRYYDNGSGITSGNIRKVNQDKYGFIWIATQDGLFRYNTVSFTRYNQDAPQKNRILGSDVRGIFTDKPSGTIWVSTSYGGLNAINASTGTVADAIPQYSIGYLRNNLIKTFTSFQNFLVLGCERGNYIIDLKRPGKTLLLPGTQTLANDYTDIIEASENRLILLVRNRGIYLYNLDTWQFTDSITERNPSVAGRRFSAFYSCSVSGDSLVAVTSSSGAMLYRISGNSIEKSTGGLYLKMLQKNQELNIRRAAFDKTGNLWMAANTGLYRYSQRRVTSITGNDEAHPNISWLKSVFEIFADKDNNIWLGCQNGLACIYNTQSAFTTYSYCEPTKTKIQHAYFLFPYDDSVTYACAQEGLYRVNRKQNVITQIDKDRTYDYLCLDPFGKIIASNNLGLFLLSDKIMPMADTYPEFKPFQTFRVNSSVRINDSCLAFGTENDKGILIWNFKRKKIENYNTASKPAALYENTINNLFLLDTNEFLILSDATLSKFDYRKKKVAILNLHKPHSGKPLNIFFDVCRLKDTLFLACYGNGIIKLDKNFQVAGEINTSVGLSNNGVYKVIPWMDSQLFISTNNGLNLYDLHTGMVRRFYKENGLSDNAFEETSGNSYKDELYFGGTNGFTTVAPDHLIQNKATPDVYFDNIQFQLQGNMQKDTLDLVEKSVSIPSNIVQTTFSFSSTDYDGSGRIAYSYRIPEVNGEWINLQNKNFITLLGINPGTYHLQVKAANEDGYWCEPKLLTLTFLPKWYQTIWFKAGILLLIAGFFYSLYRFRLHSIRRQQQIRQSISADLHDDIGGTLNTIKTFTHLARKDEKRTDILTEIENSVAQATTGLRDMIWVLDDKQDTVQEIFDRIMKFALPVANAQNIEIIADITGKDYPVTKTEKRNLMLMMKEAVNNCIKYSECKTIYLLFYKESERKIFEISDDGKGFDTQSVQKGNGLNNLQFRAGQMHYEVFIDSNIGKGTVITIKSKR